MAMKGITEATKVEKNLTPPAQLFTVPKGMPLRHNRQADEMSKNFAKNFIAGLKDPKFAEKMNKGFEEAKKNAAEQRKNELQGQRIKQRERAQPPVTQPDDYGQDDASRPAPAGAGSDKSRQEEMEEQLKKGMDMIKGLF